MKIAAQVLWRIGGESDADEEMFGRVEQLLVDEAGTLYLLDIQLNEIRVFDTAGNYLRTIGREGEGPGEFRGAVTAFLLPDDQIAVGQSMPSRIVRLTRTGDGLSDLPLPIADGNGSALLRETRSFEGGVVFSYVRPDATEAGVQVNHYLAVMSSEGELLRTLRETSRATMPGEPVSVRLPEEEPNYYSDWALGNDGQVYVAPRHEAYRIEGEAALGGEARIVTRAYESLPRTKVERDRIQNRRDELKAKYDIDMPQIETSRFQRDVQRIIPRPGGGFWVMTSHGIAERPTGALPTLDVFDAAGRFENRLTIAADYDHEYDDFRIFGDRLFVLKEARAAADQVNSQDTGGGQSTMIRLGGGAVDDGREPEPFAVVCYSLRPR
jgi:hypothetical protein